jgi:hypothetical protein
MDFESFMSVAPFSIVMAGFLSFDALTCQSILTLSTGQTEKSADRRIFFSLARFCVFYATLPA